MKELNIEEKARRYDEALAATRKLYNMRGDWTNLEIESIFPELAESEDEKIRKALIRFHKSTIDVDGIKGEDIIAWLEKQGEHANFRNKIQIGDKVTRNEDGVLVNLSQLNRVAKKDEKQVEQKPYGQRKECEDCQFNYAGECKGSCAMKRGEQKSAECRQETKPNGGIVSEDFNDGDGYYKVNLAYLSKSQVELIENLVVSWQNSANNIAAWSEEDEEIHRKCICAMRASACGFPEEEKFVEQVDNWFKCLKERYTWKPSDEQIIELRHVISGCSYDIEPLVEIEEHLKKLREE